MKKKMTKTIKRKPIPKNMREKLYFKYLGHCAYCGQPIDYKDMQVDHFAPVYLFGDNIKLENLKCACRSCNHYKSTYTLAKFREQLSLIPSRLERDSVSYKIAKRYGLIKESEESIIFYFEKLQEFINDIKDQAYSEYDLEDQIIFSDISNYLHKHFDTTIMDWLKEFKDAKF